MEEALIKRIMPNNLEAEQSVIGSMIMDREAIIVASETLHREDFYHQQYGVLFEAMVELFNEEQPVDVVTLQNRLREKDVPAELSSMEFVGELVTSVPTSANIKYYANIVREKAMLRRLIKVNEEIANQCYLDRDSVEDIMAETEKQIFNLLQNRGGEDFVPIKQIVIQALEKIEMASKQKGNVTGIATGFVDLDYRMSGLQPSDLVLVAARPSMGKTAFVLNIAQYVAFHSNLATAIFSLEMSKEQLVNRLFALEARVDAQLLRSGNLADSDWEKLIEGAGTIGKSKLIIDDTPGISISELRSKCRKYKLEQDLKLVIIDYLQLMSGSGRSDSRQQEISDISRSLKGLARELNVPVIALSQLSRQVEQRPDHRPMLSDLRESGAIEQDADVVMFIYRDDIEEYIDSIAKDVVKIIELENYEREIPDEIVRVIEAHKDKFDHLYVLFTDYTGKVERQIEKERRSADPILFGTLQDDNTQTVVDRFYYLGDWEDEFCDLTLDKMVGEAKDVKKRDITHTISTPEDIEELKNQIIQLEETHNGVTAFKVSDSPKEVGLFSKIRTFLSKL